MSLLTLVEMARQYAGGIHILRDWLGDNAQTISKEHAVERSQICLDCPKNKRGWFVPKAVSRAIKQQVELKNNLKLTVPYEHELKTCKVCRCPIALKIWLPLNQLTKYMKPDEFRKFPSFCWIRTEWPGVISTEERKHD